jgi:hypothetical protein
MKRLAQSALGVFLASAAIGLAGCDSGGIEPGMPTDQTPSISPEDMKKMANMATMPKSAEEAKKKNPDAGTTPEAAPAEKK